MDDLYLIEQQLRNVKDPETAKKYYYYALEAQYNNGADSAEFR